MMDAAQRDHCRGGWPRHTELADPVLDTVSVVEEGVKPLPPRDRGGDHASVRG